MYLSFPLAQRGDLPVPEGPGSSETMTPCVCLWKMRARHRNNVNVYTTRRHVPSNALPAGSDRAGLVVARRVDVTRPKSARPAGVRVERVPPDAPGVVRQKM